MPWTTFKVLDDDQEIIERHKLPVEANGVPCSQHEVSASCTCGPRYSEDECGNIVYIHWDPMTPLTEMVQ